MTLAMIPLSKPCFKLTDLGAQSARQRQALSTALKQCVDVFIEILENGSEKDFGSISNYEISVFICRKFLNEKNEFDSEDFYSDMGEEDIINVFCGN